MVAGIGSYAQCFANVLQFPGCDKPLCLVQVRLREVVQDLLGPLSWSPPTLDQQQEGDMDDGSGDSSSSSGSKQGWQPVMLGHDKRRLLRYEVLSAIYKENRSSANQALVNEVGVHTQGKLLRCFWTFVAFGVVYDPCIIPVSACDTQVRAGAKWMAPLSG